MFVLICVVIVAIALLWSLQMNRGRPGALLAVALAAVMLFALAAPQRAEAQLSVGVSVGFGPPALPSFYQPYATQPNMLWQPGYWGYSQDGYYWVPGTWVQPPQVGLLWTPGYWGFSAGLFNWNQGYWGRNVGYYGGINYGYGYYGSGYGGGRWYGNAFRYNTSVTNVNTTYIHNTYVDRTVYVNQNTLPRTAYNGGPNGIATRPSSAQLAVANQQHYPMTAAQTAHVQVSEQNRSYLATVNHGSPGQVSVAKPLATNNRPAGFTPVTTADRAQAVVPKQAPAQPQYAAPVKQQNAAPVQPKQAPAQHYTAPVQPKQAPAQHYTAPVQPKQAATKPQHTTTQPKPAAQPPKPKASPKPVDVAYWNGK